MCTQLRILRTVNYAPAYYTLNINVLKTDLFCAALKQPMSACITCSSRCDVLLSLLL